MSESNISNEQAVVDESLQVSQPTSTNVPSTQSAAAASTSDGENIDSSNAVDESEPAVVLRNPADRPVYKLTVKLIETYKHINKVRAQQGELFVFPCNSFVYIC
jgi:hypothetical protein